MSVTAERTIGSDLGLGGPPVDAPEDDHKDLRLSTFGQNVGSAERVLSIIAGGALAIAGLRNGSKLGYAATAAGVAIAARGATGHCPVYGAAHKTTAPLPDETIVPVKQCITIGKSPEEVYRFWRNFENLPVFMDHLESVTVNDDIHSHWKAKAPLGRTVSWDAEIIADEPGTHIAWRSLPGSQILNDGMVSFRQAPGDRGTEVHVSLRYQPPAGQIGRAMAALSGEEPTLQIQNDLLRLKRLLETGEIATTEGQSHGPAVRVMSKREG